MSEPNSSPSIPAPRGVAALEWIVVLGLSAALGWTTMCLGGYLTGPLVVSSTLVFALAALGAVAWVTRRGGQRIEFNLAVLLPLPFLVFALGSVLWIAPAAWLAWREWLLWFQMWIVFALVLHFGRTRGQTAVWIGTLLALGLIGVGLAAYQRYSDPGWMMLGRRQAAQFVGRSAGMFGVPNSLAALLELIAPVCLCLVSSRVVRPLAKVLCAWLAGLFIFAIVLTGSRGGWLGLGTALLLWPILTGRAWRKKIGGVLLVLIAAGGVFWGLYRNSAYARERIQPFLEGRFEPSRPIIWRAGVEIWLTRPWLGTGAASYNVFFDQHRESGFLNEPLWAHNDYLNTLSDYGVIGFVLWAGAGAAIFSCGWREIRRVRRSPPPTSELFLREKWKLGLLLGLIAFAVHLTVEFHTKIPALAFAAAMCAGLLVRDDPRLIRSVERSAGWGVGGLLGLVAAGLAWRLALPLYRAEALRFDARWTIDQYAVRKEGNLPEIVGRARKALAAAVRLDPRNGQAWSDLAYATALSARFAPRDAAGVGKFAELAADEAIQRCAVNAEFWVRRAVSLDLQSRQPEAEECFRRAVELAPNTPAWWYYYGGHLARFSTRKADALKALDTCLTLDPQYGAASILRQQLLTRQSLKNDQAL